MLPSPSLRRSASANFKNTALLTLVRRADGFHSADAVLALVMLAAGPIDLKLPRERAAKKKVA